MRENSKPQKTMISKGKHKELGPMIGSEGKRWSMKIPEKTPARRGLVIFHNAHRCGGSEDLGFIV